MGVHVAFDIGNVLCQFDIMKFVIKLAKTAQVSEHDAWFFLDHLQKMQDIGVTTVGHGLEYKYKLSKDDLITLVDTWNKTLTPSETMLKFMDNLRADGVKIALLSNMGPEHITYLRAICPPMFEKTVQHISCEVGARKPQKLFFQSFCLDNDDFLCSTGPRVGTAGYPYRDKAHMEEIHEKRKRGERVDFSGCLYVDDIEENLKVGKHYGFKVYRFNLDDTLKLSLAGQKLELDKLKRLIYEKS